MKTRGESFWTSCVVYDQILDIADYLTVDTGMTLYWVNRGSVFLESVYFDSEWEASNHNRTQSNHTKNGL